MAYKNPEDARKAQRRWVINNREQHRKQSRESMKRIRDRDPKAYNAKRRQQRKDNPESEKKAQRRKHLKHNYGISEKQFDILLSEQGNVCAICKTDAWGWRGQPCVDHDHYTGKVRGLLCSKCNLGIGHLNDSIELLTNAIEYLTETKQ